LLVLALAAVAAAVIGSRTPHVPSPFGPAHNGVLVYESEGDLLAYDVVTERSTPLIAGTTFDHDPYVSPDGTRLLFDRQIDGPLGPQLMVSSIDGTHAVPLTAPVANVDSINWAPDSARVSMDSDADSVAAVRIAGLDGSLIRVVAQGGDTAHPAIEDVQWRP